MESYLQSVARRNQQYLRETFIRKDVTTGPSTEANANKAEGKDYINRWLSEAQRRPDWEAKLKNQDQTARSSKKPPSWRPHNLPAVDLGQLEQQAAVRRRRGPSPDSSILPLNPKRRQPTNGRGGLGYRPSSRWQGEHQDSRHRPATLTSGSPEPSIEEPARFEKRPRHKTRPDRYETNKGKRRRDKDGSEEPVEKARRTKEGKKKNTISARRDVVKNFASGAILTRDRLTLHNSLAPGLFGNARAASPNYVADLAYNDMRFLQESRQHDQPDRAPKTTKSSQKDHDRRQRERARERQELTSFFISDNDGYGNRQASLDTENSHGGHDGSGWGLLERRGEHHNHRHNLEDPSVVAESGIFHWASGSPRAHIYHQQRGGVPDTTQISWPPTTPDRLVSRTAPKDWDDALPFSSPPGRARRDLEDTGVFKGLAEEDEGRHKYRHRRRISDIEGRRQDISSPHPDPDHSRGTSDHDTPQKAGDSALKESGGNTQEQNKTFVPAPVPHGKTETEKCVPNSDQATERGAENDGVLVKDSHSGQAKNMTVSTKPLGRQQAAENARIPVYAHQGCQTETTEPPRESQTRSDRADGIGEVDSHPGASQEERPDETLARETATEYLDGNAIPRNLSLSQEEYIGTNLQSPCQSRAWPVTLQPELFPEEHRIPSATSHTFSSSARATSWLPHRPLSSMTSMSVRYPAVPHLGIAGHVDVDMSQCHAAKSSRQEWSESLGQYISHAADDVLGKRLSPWQWRGDASEVPGQSKGWGSQGIRVSQQMTHQPGPPDWLGVPTRRAESGIPQRFEWLASRAEPGQESYSQSLHFDVDLSRDFGDSHPMDESLRASHRSQFDDTSALNANERPTWASHHEQQRLSSEGPNNGEDERAEMVDFWGHTRLQQF